jgi:uncharacterized protein GlcG (DUF336 family)
MCPMHAPPFFSAQDGLMRKPLTASLAGVTAVLALGYFALGASIGPAVRAQTSLDCPVGFDRLRSALEDADADDSTGLNNHYWAVVVNREGTVCAVAYSGRNRDSQWLLSRQIAAAKAFTANGLSLDGAPISTAQLYPWVQPGAPANPLFGLAAGNPVNPDAIYKGDYNQFGTRSDPMVGQRVGGTITFGGGLSLYSHGDAIGGLGLSGDTACADHSTAWRVRANLRLAPSVPNDTMVLDDTSGHPHCPNDGGTQGARQ